MQEEPARAKQAALEMEKEIAALVAREDYSGAAKVYSRLIRHQEEQAIQELLAQHQETKGAEDMAECLAGNDYADDPCGHRPGPVLDDATGGPSLPLRTDLYDCGHEGESRQ